ncbi:hypothetical protein BP5796_11264 [Coleophoma crateriformis]|uniref:CPAF-like PDZ domain-containing protein n=1 Tax=Coleophoma crateriformis TaxID=565419 RepID=A0A3D8QHR1_9HELO|nr:hypothetical protein BP5796_11264 [Coleophoma crateriformis]
MRTTLATVVALFSAVCRCSSPAYYATTNSTNATATAACAIVSSLSAAQIVTAPSATPTVDAALAYECLNSVPLNKTAALALVDACEPYIEWQSDLAYLKDPPATYFYPPHDVLGTLASVKANLEADVYANEYLFQVDLYQVFTPAHDGHFVLYPDALTKAFEFGRGVPIVSISKDGVEIPKIYSYYDVVADPSTAPVLLEVNGVDAATFIEDFAFTASFNQDKDAAYNTMFFEKAFIAAGVGTGYFSINGRVRYIYPGANTTYTWDNGTTNLVNNVAHVKGDFTGVTDGPSFYQTFCVYTTTQATAAAAATQATPVPTGPVGYPPPVVSSNDTIVSGYFLDTPGFEDVAVLSLLAMESESIAEFQAVTQAFLADAVAAGKTKLVLDLQANAGGYILHGYDTFRQLFPEIVQRDYTRFRENEQLLTIADIFSDAIPANYTPETASADTIGYYESFFNWRYDYNVTEQPFPSFDAKFAPHEFMGDDYTSIVRWNLNDPLTTINSTWGFGIDITGYGSRTNFTQPFAAENIIILYDGYCASTCIILSEFLKWDAGVKSVAMGGRPNKDPIQGMGGVKGAQSFGWSDILYEAEAALPLATPEQAAILNKLNDIPIQRSSSNSVNLRDLITPNHLVDQTPAQMVAEYSDCRLYWTAPMITDVSKVWEAVATAAWGGGSCAEGGISNSTKRGIDAPVRGRSPWEKREAARKRAGMVIPRDSKPGPLFAASRQGTKAIP